MYPNLYYLFRHLFGVSLPALRVVNSFGFFVAIAFLAAAYTLTRELKRKEAQGYFQPEYTSELIGGPAKTGDLISNFLIGFLFGYKVLGLFYASSTTPDFEPQAYLFSTQGNLFIGLLMGGLMAGYVWYEHKKRAKPVPETVEKAVWPHTRVGDITMLAALFGFAGAKLFDNLENWDRFVKDPIANLLAPSGLTFYGGLICAAAAIAWYLRKHKMPFLLVSDGVAPGLMLAYGIGRIGCQVSGDGDWGVYNSAYISDGNGKAIAAAAEQFTAHVQQHHGYFIQNHRTLEAVPTAHMPSFAGLPDWLFAYSYPHNVNKEGIPMADCSWDDFCNMLPTPVFPTAFYEAVICLGLFGLLWMLRKKIQLAGRLFAVYLFVNGLERFLIEKIRVNTEYNLFGFHPSQAELISSGLMLASIVLWMVAPRLQPRKTDRITNQAIA